MRRWRDHRTDLVHGFDPLQQNKKERNAFVLMFCGERLVLRCAWASSGLAYIMEVPTRRNLTDELPSVKTPLTCIGCLAEGR
jgi:hypothetical protein